MPKAQLIIPMSGIGNRFIQAGYEDVKPLIKVGGQPIISWVLRMFPAIENITFICREKHLEQTPMRKELTKLCPHGKIVSIEGHKKGPVYAVLKAVEHLDDSAQTLVSYCDYYMHWDCEAFLKEALERGSDGGIPCYKEFHPHLIPKKNLYASCKIDGEDNLVEIREKFSWTEDKGKSLQSPGVYYFRTGEMMKKYFSLYHEQSEGLNGEFYASLVYNLLVSDGLKVWVPHNVSKFCQWGTPHDLQEYEYWTNMIKGFNS